MQRIAYFISPHGFGHAARAAAVMTAIQEFDPTIRFEIFTRVPAWFFDDSLPCTFGYHAVLTDIGLVQKTPTTEDLAETVRQLDVFLPFDPVLIRQLAQHVTALGCQLLICDIAPLGIVVAQEANIPSILIENFTWDWIYAGYANIDARMSKYVEYLRTIFAAADYHIQTEPLCEESRFDLQTLPISRNITTPREQIRKAMELPLDTQAVMITMGGVQGKFEFLDRLAHQDQLYFLIAGWEQRLERRGHLWLLPRRFHLRHPDLVNAADAIISKAGYSTIAETFYAGIPFGYIQRPQFRESHILTAYIENNMRGLALTEAEFQHGDLVGFAEKLLIFPRIVRDASQNGAISAARFILKLLN